jgi:hypothetical protein
MKDVVPAWSFLAVEPIVAQVRRRMPEAFHAATSPKSGAAARQIAFQRFFEAVERHLSGKVTLPTRQLAIQVFYAMVDLASDRNLTDRELQRYLSVILGGMPSDIPTHAVVGLRNSATVA